MRPCLLCLPVLVHLTSACSSTPTQHGPGHSFDAPEPPDGTPGCDASRTPIEDACVLDEALGVFVSSRVIQAGGGTRARPYASLAEGLERARADKKRVYVCEGTYDDPLTFADGVSIFGGLSCDGGEWRGGGKRARITTRDGSPVNAKDITRPTRIDAIEIVARDATLPSTSSIGLVVANVPGLAFSHVLVRAGAGADGSDGAIPVQLVNGPSAEGVAGEPSARCVAGCSANPFQGYPDPRASRGGVNACQGVPGYAGQAGSAGGWSGGFRVDAGGGILGAPYVYALGVDATAAEPPPFLFVLWGAPGHHGGPATKGLMRHDGFFPGAGHDGTDGVAGGGGTGGRGIGLLDHVVPSSQQVVGARVWGWSGGGGGAGGCPGLAGHGGKGGGASLGVISAWAPPSFAESEILSGSGGRGGKGTFGGKPTAGGAGGAASGPAGTQGAPGGWGGRGGYGSHGDGGPSAALVVDGPRPRLSSTTLAAGKGGDGQPETKDGDQIIPASATGASQRMWEL